MKYRMVDIFVVVRMTLAAMCMALVAGCSDRDALQRLEDAEKIMAAEPERALEMVESVDPTKLRTEEHRARYALIYSEACYYNYVDIESDSLTRPMMRYYLESEKHDERARAMYQHAVVAQRCGELAEAMVSLMPGQ